MACCNFCNMLWVVSASATKPWKWKKMIDPNLIILDKNIMIKCFMSTYYCIQIHMLWGLGLLKSCIWRKEEKFEVVKWAPIITEKSLEVYLVPKFLHHTPIDVVWFLILEEPLVLILIFLFFFFDRTLCLTLTLVFWILKISSFNDFHKEFKVGLV
jgi:hypothetical protein